MCTEVSFCPVSSTQAGIITAIQSQVYKICEETIRFTSKRTCFYYVITPWSSETEDCYLRHRQPAQGKKKRDLASTGRPVTSPLPPQTTFLCLSGFQWLSRTTQALEETPPSHPQHHRERRDGGGVQKEHSAASSNRAGK